MSEEGPSTDLDANALAILAAYRRSEQLPEAVESRVWDRVESETAVAASPTSTRWGLVALIAAAAVGLLAIGIRSFDAEEAKESAAGHMAVDRGSASESHGVATVGQPEAEPSKRRSNGAASVDAQPEKTPAPESEAETAADSTAPAPQATPSTKASRRPKARSKLDVAPEVEAASSLAEETALLRRAQAAMRSGNPQKALSLLAQCQRAFPGGLLREERDALKVLALCGAGKTSKGKAAAAAFLRARPSSALAPRVRGACSDED